MKAKIIDIIILVVICLLLIGVLWVNKIEPVEITKIVRVEVPIVVEKEVTRIVEVPVVAEKIVYVDRYTNATNITDEELTRAFAIISEGSYNHQYFIDNPQEQNATSGNTTFHIKWVGNYRFIWNLLDRAYGE